MSSPQYPTKFESLDHELSKFHFSVNENCPAKELKLTLSEKVTCAFWYGRPFISGTDIVKVLLYKFSLAGIEVTNKKKFEEGIFSDLRNLKPGIDAVLEEPRSKFLDFMHKLGAIRTQKKQKVFYWERVDHKKLFMEARDRELKRKVGHMNSPYMYPPHHFPQAYNPNYVPGTLPPSQYIPSDYHQQAMYPQGCKLFEQNQQGYDIPMMGDMGERPGYFNLYAPSVSTEQNVPNNGMAWPEYRENSYLPEDFSMRHNMPLRNNTNDVAGMDKEFEHVLPEEPVFGKPFEIGHDTFAADMFPPPPLEKSNDDGNEVSGKPFIPLDSFDAFLDWGKKGQPKDRVESHDPFLSGIPFENIEADDKNELFPGDTWPFYQR